MDLDDDSTILTDVQSDATPELDAPSADTPAKTQAEAAPAPAPAEPVKSERELMLEAIEARHHAEMTRESGQTLEEFAPSVDDQLAAQTQQTAPEPEAAPAPAKTSATGPGTSVRVKIDGVESEVPFDDMVRSYQKNAAADKKLAEASRVQRDALEMAERVRQQKAWLDQQIAQQQGAAPAPATPQAPDPAAEQEGRQFLRALFEGDEETALTKLAELTKGRHPPPIPMAQIADQVSAQIQQKLQIDSALAQHRQAYPEVYADPDMEQFVLTKVQSRRQATGEEFFAALHEVSTEFAQKFGWSANAPQGRPTEAAPTTSNTRTQKLERKASIDNLSSLNTKTGSTEAVPESTSDVIAQMRQARIR